jgi:MFS family permease
VHHTGALSLAGPFYPNYARSVYGASPFGVGAVFAAMPLIQIVTSPLWGKACSRYGRLACYAFSLVFLTGRKEGRHVGLVEPSHGP